ncbi:hypothetical protein NQ318_010462 [Aromia moschata]|uniref:DUF4817 domain-containing protein n=1 Tax=Aromia moschata TaxID=1265417 RepID=A0AAV8YBE4_9CUCU|nr:hypothetical protein NQ318_010462 [Aromia moschata]
MRLSDTQRIEILILVRCGDKTRRQKQVCEIFNTKYTDRRISKSTIFLNLMGNAFLDHEQKLNILLDIQDNPHKPTAADNNDVSKTSLLRLLKNEKYRPYKIHLSQFWAGPALWRGLLNASDGITSSDHLCRMKRREGKHCSVVQYQGEPLS